jgi:tetratricopeptide (TPR) repeat protein
MQLGRRPLKFCCIVGVALALTWAPPLRAETTEDAQRHFAAGKKAYEIGAYDEAIKEFGEAYRLIDDPALLYNLGQAHRLAGHTVEALRLYRMFLLKVPSSPNRDEVTASITELQKQLAGSPQTKPAETAAPTETTPPSAPETAVARTDQPAHKKASYKKWLPWTIVGIVVAGAAVGVGVGVGLSSSHPSASTTFGTFKF